MAKTIYFKLISSLVVLSLVFVLYSSYLLQGHLICQCSNVTQPSPENQNDNEAKQIPLAQEEVLAPEEEKEENKSEKLQVVIAIPTIPATLERRMHIRMTYMSEYKEVNCSYCPTPHPNPKVRVLFFLGLVKEGVDLIKAEQKIFNDIVILDQPEGMNDGKTYEMLLWLTKNVKASFIMKSDDDSYIVVPNLLKRLDNYTAQFTNRHIYYGFSIFEHKHSDTRHLFMAGMGYILSFELTERLMPIGRTNKMGPEDIKVGNWVHRAMAEGVDVVQIGNTRHFHDTPHHKGIVSWQYDCHDVLLHQLKSNPWWEEAANFYLNCCGVDERPPDHAICTAKIESQTICNNNATRGIDCFALKEHTQMTVDRTGNDVFVRDEDIDME